MLQMDRLYEAVEAKGPVCVGLDTDFSYLPEEFVDSSLTAGENIFRFNKEIIEATKDVAGCYKVQIAYYESYGLDGMLAYKNTLAYLREKNLIAIADVKRGDIAKTAEMYAKAHFEGDFEADFMTLAPYMGMDSICLLYPSIWAFRFGFGYLLGAQMGMGAVGIWLAMLLDWAFRSVMFLVRFVRGKWKEKKVI